MHRSFRAPLGLLAVAVLCFAADAQGQADVKHNATTAVATASTSFPSVRGIRVLSDRNAVEIEIESSDHLVPQTQLLPAPDRLVVDFPNAVPGNGLRSQSVNRGGVKDVRVGLFTANPPVTRIVFDLSAAQSYQVFPNGRAVIVKLNGPVPDASEEGVDDFPPETPATRPGLVNTNYAGRPLPFSNATRSNGTRPDGTSSDGTRSDATRSFATQMARPSLEVSFKNGQLAIHSNKASLSAILFAVHQRTGADIAVPAGAEQEQVAADIGPAPAAEVLAHLLNGSRFNFLILNSASDPRVLDRVILSPRDGSLVLAALPQTGSSDEPPVAGESGPTAPTQQGQLGPVPPPDGKPEQDDPSD